MDILKIENLCIFLFLTTAFYLGKHAGYIDGYEAADFDRHFANQKLKQCYRIMQ